MGKMKMSFKHKVLIPTIILFIVSIFIISVNNYRLMEATVSTKTNANLDMFTNNIFVQISYLEIVMDTVKKAINEKNVASARAVAYILDNSHIDKSVEELQNLADIMDIIDLCIVGPDGILQYSNIEDFIGFDYNSTEITKKYMALTDGTRTEIAEDPRISVLESEMYAGSSHYAGVTRTDDAGFIQVGFNVTAFEELTRHINIQEMIDEIKIENSGYGIVLFNEEIIAHPNVDKVGLNVSDQEWFDQIDGGSGFAWIDIDDATYYAGYENMEGYTVVGLVPEEEYNRELKRAQISTVIFSSFALIIMTMVVYVIMNNLLKPIKKVTEGLGEISNGNFDARVEGQYNDEFALIKEAVNDMAENITKYLGEKLEAERLAHEAELERLELLVKIHHDALTSVYNRRYLNDNLSRIIRMLSRVEGMLSVLMIDIDFFKAYNDTYGHSAGDTCLREVAKALTSITVREDDFVARYGGEEFIIVLPGTNESGARHVADKLIKAVRGLKIKHEASEVDDFVTISIGITTSKARYTQSDQDYIKRADEALYESKNNGRNQYTFYEL